MSTPATLPESGTTPGNAEQKPAQAPSGEGQNNNQNPSGDSVTVSAKELAQLRRDAARAKTAQSRADLANRQNNGGNNGDSDDPAVQELNRAHQARAQAEQELHQERLKNKTRELLEKDEFKDLPKSTRDLILRNPSALTQATSVEEAILDVEDFVREQVVDLPSSARAAVDAKKPADNVETPPHISPGSPSPSNPEGLEDLSRLSPNERVNGAIRNSMRKAGLTVNK